MQEIETRLERGLVGKVVSFITIYNETVSGKVERLSVWPEEGELMVSFMVSHERYKADIRYFSENITIHNGNTRGTGTGVIRRLLERD